MNKVHFEYFTIFWFVQLLINLFLLVDWASLAQQWIKMKETTPVMPPGQQIRPPTCEPNLLGPNQNLGSQNTSNVSTSNKTISDHNTTTNPVRG